METFEIKKILVPTDFSELSDNAIKTACAICVRQRASMVLLNVYEAIPNVALPYGGMGYYGSTTKEVENVIMSKLKKMAEEINVNSNIMVEVLMRTGNIADAICSVADEAKTDIMVMGTHGTSGLREFFIGSNAYSVVKRSHIPVLTVPSEGNWTEFKKILFPVRMINGAFDKYEAIRPIIAKNNSSLIVLGLAENNRPSQLPELSELLNDFKSKLAEDGVSYDSQLYYGNKFPEKILETARNYDSDLIVITASLDSTIKDFFIGPYAQQIVNHSKIPVLTIRPRIAEATSVLTEQREMEQEINPVPQFAV